MPTVPVYQRGQVGERPLMQQGVTVQASPEAFGAAIGRGMQGLAQGIGRFGEAMAEVQQLEDVARAKEADNQYSSWLRERMYGENGFMLTEGRNAVESRSTFEAEAEEARKRFGANLTGGAARAYSNASQARIQSVYDQSIRHTADERKTWFKQASAARIQTFADDALANYDNPEMLRKNLALGQAELRQQAELEGWDSALLQLRESEYLSGVHKNVALRIAQTDPLAAQDYVKANENQMRADDVQDMDGIFAPLVIEEKAKQHIGRWEQETNNAKASGKVISYVNQGAVRNQQITDTLANRLTDSVVSVYGPGYRAEIYSGGQPAKGTSDRRVGSTRHDDGRAADVRIFGPDGKQLKGDQLAPIAQYWLARGYGGVGMEMRGGGIHLDEHTDRARTWNYVKQGGQFTAGQRAAVEAGLRGEMPTISGAQPGSAFQPAQGQGDMVAFIEGIENPLERDAVIKRMNAINAIRASQSKAQTEMWQAQAFGFVDQGGSPDDLPMDVKMALGRTEMEGLWSYYEKTATGRQVTDESVKLALQDMYANDPEAFAQLNPFEYYPHLSKQDREEVNTWRQTALTDIRKAREEGLNLTSAWSQAAQSLEGVGITATGLTGSAREEAEKRIADFNRALTRLMDEFKRENGKNPNQMETQSMVNRLLLPIVVKEERSIWNPLKTPWSSTFNREGMFLFEAATLPDGADVDVAVKYEDIPVDLRRGIASDLERELGRKPTTTEIADRYEQFILGQ